MLALECSVQLLEQADRHGISIDQSTGVITITDSPNAGEYTIARFEERPAVPPEMEGRHVIWLRPVTR